MRFCDNLPGFAATNSVFCNYMDNEWTMKPPRRHRPFQSTDLSVVFLYLFFNFQSILFLP